jgi:type IV pilus assembly protein PilY1
VLPVNVTTGGSSYDDTTTLLNSLYGLESSGGTPLRDALKDVGDYFDQAGGDGGIGGSSPYASEADGGACQQSFAIVVTDGFWNGYLSGIGNEDGSEGSPYADTWSGTLADVAMKYYKTRPCLSGRPGPHQLSGPGHLAAYGDLRHFLRRHGDLESL